MGLSLTSRARVAVLVATLAGACAPEEHAANAVDGGVPPRGDAGFAEGDAGTAEGPGEGEGEGEGEETWRSELFPAQWTPAFALADGRALHDFSYAGYRNGELIPERSSSTAVTGLDATGATDATQILQAALDNATGVVTLPAGLFRVDGRLFLRNSNVVLRGAGATATRLFFTSMDADFAGLLTVGAPIAHGADVLLAADAFAKSHEVLVLDASAISPGDDVAIGAVISGAFVEDHGMAGVWGPFNDTWQAFARRTVVAVDLVSHTVTLDVPLRSTLLARDGASLRIESGGAREVGIEHLGIASAIDDGGAHAQDQVAALELVDVTDAWVRDVASFAPPVGDGDAHFRSGGIRVIGSKRVTVQDVVLEGAQHRGEGGNGYLLEVRTSNEILVKDVVARAGRHNFIQNWGFGTSGCVFLRITSSESATVSDTFPIALPSGSEFHHSLATANLIDDARIDDGWAAGNRGDESSGAGHSASENVFWHVRGVGRLRTFQYGWGYVVGTDPDVQVLTAPDLFSVGVSDEGTAPVDHFEGEGLASTLDPPSLYEAQRSLRLQGTP